MIARSMLVGTGFDRWGIPQSVHAARDRGFGGVPGIAEIGEIIIVASR